MFDFQNTNVIYLTAGAGGMYCGSCLHDNALAKALTQQGWQIQLVPTYTPIRTDETDVSVDHVLFGGLNVYLQQKLPLFRYLPAILDRILDDPRLIRRVTANAMQTDPKTLGSLAHSMLLGEKGNQRKEVGQVVEWLSRQSPDLLVLSNLLIGGCIPAIKQQLDIPVLVTLQGDDVFLDSLLEPYKTRCIDRMREIAKSVDGFIVHSQFYRDYMSAYFDIPLENFHVTPLGIDTSDFQSFDPLARWAARTAEPTTIGYLARLAPEKGLDNLVDALIHGDFDSGQPVNLKIAGWLGPENQDYAQALWEKLDAAGWAGRYEYVGSVDRQQKMEFLNSIDLLCVPTHFQEPKGLYALEAMAAGVPIVVPAHGAFPEMIAASSGGLLVPPHDVAAIATTLAELIQDRERRLELGQAGHKFVHEKRHAQAMAQVTGDVFREILSSN